MKKSDEITPFATHFGEETPQESHFLDENGKQLVDMSNPTRLGDEGDESC